jgi:hypothetical protein
MSSANINFEFDILSKKTSFLTDKEKQATQNKDKEKRNKLVYTQNHPIFQKMRVTHKKYAEIEDHFNKYYDYAKYSMKTSNKGKVDPAYFDMLKLDFNKEVEFKRMIELSLHQIFIDRMRIWPEHFSSIDIVTNRKPNKLGKLHPAHPAIQTAVYFLFIFDKKRNYVRKVIERKKKEQGTFYHATSLYGQGSAVMSGLICSSFNLPPVDSFVILFVLDQKTEMQQLNESYQAFDFNMNFFMIASFLLSKAANPNFYTPLIDKFVEKSETIPKAIKSLEKRLGKARSDSKDGQDGEDITSLTFKLQQSKLQLQENNPSIHMHNCLRSFHATATMCPGLIVNVVSGKKNIHTDKYNKSVQDLCYHLYSKGPSFILCIMAAFNMDVIGKIENSMPTKPNIDTSYWQQVMISLIKTQGNWNKPELPIKKAVQIYNSFSKTKYKSVNKFLIEVGSWMKTKRFLISTKRPEPERETIMKNLVGFDMDTIKKLFTRKPYDDGKHYVIDYVELNKFIIFPKNKKKNKKKKQKGGRRKQKTLRRSRKFDGDWEIIKKKSKRRTLKRIF